MKPTYRGVRSWIQGLLLLAAVNVTLATPAVAPAAPYADVIVVMDESGSMSGEQAFIGPAMIALNTGLIGKGLSPNQFGLVGFGASAGHGIPGHTHSVGGGAFGTAAQFNAATGSLVVSGGSEDGYSGIAHALTYPFRAGSARNIILVTDEDRDNEGGPNYAAVLAGLQAKNAILNVIVNADLRNGANQTALGIDSEGNAFIADGMGGFTISPGGHVAGAFGTTAADYINLAFATGGAAFDLNQLRAGGLLAQSFAAAFTQIKVQEIAEQVVPEPTSLALFGGAALAAGYFGWRRRKPVAA